MDAGTISLGDTSWTAVELEGRPVAGDGAPNLVFDLEESRVAGFAGLNRLMGTLAQDELRFGPLATTLMAGTTLRWSASVGSSRHSPASPPTDSRDARSRSSQARRSPYGSRAEPPSVAGESHGATLRRLWSTAPNAS